MRIFIAAILAVFCIPALAGSCPSWDRFNLDSTFLYDRKAKAWEQCPGMGWDWAITPNRHGYESMSEAVGGCRSFAKQDEWARRHYEGKELQEQLDHSSAFVSLLTLYQEDTGKKKAHGRKLRKWWCKNIMS